ncbi:hypothetical protein VPHD292_0044 [Vibrio phage D292]
MTTDVLVTINYNTKWVMSEKDAASLLQILSRTNSVELSEYKDGDYHKCELKSPEMNVVSLQSSLNILVQEAELLEIPVHKFIKETKGIHL